MKQSTGDTSANFRPIKSPRDTDPGQYRMQLLPTGHDLAKAMVIVIVLVTGLHVAPQRKELWTTYVQDDGGQHLGKLVADSSIAKAGHVIEEPVDDTVEGSSLKVHERASNRSLNAVHMQLTTVAHPKPESSQTSSKESPIDIRVEEQTGPPPVASAPTEYFDNAGKSYPSKAARDAAENDRLVDSLARFPAMTDQQREILRQRANARLEMLDRQQRINSAL